VNPPTSTVERERKLTIGDSFRLPKLPGSRLPRRLLTSTYYDTSQYDLSRGGITLRHRIEGGKRAWQLKLPLLNTRQEVEVADHSEVPPTGLTELLVSHVDKRPLAPVATLRVWRAGTRVRLGSARADVTVDQVSVIRHGRLIQKFRELEIEQLDGPDDALDRMDRFLRDAGARDHDGRPKLFRALSLPPAGPGPAPAPDVPVLQHVKWALARHVWWLFAHDPGARLGREPECVHQMRVAARQLRAVLHAARPLLVREWERALQDELAWMIALLGPARDLDVQLEYFADEATELKAHDRRLLAHFTAHLQKQRQAVQEVLRSELNSARYFQFLDRIREAAHDPSALESDATLPELARREFKSLRKAVRRARAEPSNATMHEIRIKTKRARYATELAAHVLGKPAARFIRRARKVQDLLGRHQDAVQAELHVRAFLKHSTGVRAGLVGGLLVERQRARRRSVRKKFARQCNRLLQAGKSVWR
jgi:CHAD domain-containing protein